MPRKIKSKEPEHTMLSIKVREFTARVHAATNHDIFDSRNTYDDTPVYRFHNDIEITGECSYPDERQQFSVN